ncbi:MAG: sigma-70 family RNA polymerase sigma factor [Rhodospirillales bacterium]
MTEVPASTDVKVLIIEIIPNLRAFARTLVNDRDRADDLVQETVLKALSNLDRFQIGTNIRAWLFTILRNSFFSELRKQRREVADSDGKYAAQLTTRATQVDKVELRDFRRALEKLPSEQREALMLVGPAGFSYEEAATICGCAVGTIKSRVNRGRNRLTEMIEGETPKPSRRICA